MGEVITIDQAKKSLRANFDSGSVCPCCGQFVKMYHRPITSSMAYGLILLTRHHDTQMRIHVESFLKKLDVPASIRGDMSKLKHWGLMQPIPGLREDGNPSNGIYVLTEYSFDFVNRLVNVPKYVKIYNNKFLGFDGPEVSIVDCLKNKFDYSELMNS